MYKQHGRRIWSMILVICLVLTMLPVFVSEVEVEAEAVSGINSLTCASFISNSTRQNYIDVMMRYYINNSSTLQSQLNNGNSVVFMFEGGSDYYDSYAYADGYGQTRMQAVCIVVQMDSSGNAYIAFYSEKCCSLPDDANYVTPGYETSGSTTILDGIYQMTTVDHNGNYAAHTTSCYTGWYTPYSGSTGYSDDCNGINIHTRGVNYALSYGGNSMGCQLIGYGASSSNDYNTFMKVVTGISFNAYDGTQRCYSYGSHPGYYTNTGYYVVDRQLGITSPSGVDYGSGSMAELYTTNDIKGITAYSTAARANADFDYASECDYYPAHCKIKTSEEGVEINSQPCSVGTVEDCTTLDTVSLGTTFTATGLFQNEYGNYWYRVTTSNGKTGYIYAGEADYVEEITSDITITDYDVPNGHVSGNVFYVTGKIASKYNRIDTAAVWIYSGFGTSGSTVTGHSDNVGSFSYTLDNSTIDYNTAFNQVAVGKNTYAISCTYTNYYAEGPTTLKSNTGTIPLVEEYFVVVSSSVDQSSCNHSFSTTVVEAGTCTAPGKSVQSCSVCGQVNEVTSGADGHSYGNWTTVSATCTTDGYKKRTCSACGDVETVTIDATGHSYDMKKTDATCSSYAVYTMTCSGCGDSYSMSADQMMSTWLEEIPAGMDASLFKTKTQYRYSDCTSTSWVKSGTGSVEYVSSWPSGFSTGSSLYSKYNKASSKKTASETATTKTVINSDTVTGYLYYHWCYADSYYSQAASSGSYTTFHAYYDTTDPDTFTCDTSDMSYKTAHSTCSNSDWYFVTEVYTQSYTTYAKQADGKTWGDWSSWSDTVYTAVENSRKVETRTVYQLKSASLGTHVWAEGVCSACGTQCAHNYSNGYCTVCGMEEPNLDYYLFGYINGANYACEEDASNIGDYKFVNGKLVVTFTEQSYVAVKNGNNSKWFMTNGYPGDDATSAVLYTTDITGEASDKLLVPKGREITFTLLENPDGSLTLSYVAAECEHSWSDGVCSTCDEVCDHYSWTGGVCGNCGFACGHENWTEGECDVCDVICSHTYVNNICTICGMNKPVKDYYLFGYINGADYGCEGDYANLGEYKFVNGTLTAIFQTDSYVAVKSGDNKDWYMTNTWLGTEVTAATLYNTNTGSYEKLFVPGGKIITFNLIDNGNDTYMLSYSAKTCSHAKHDVNGVCSTCGQTVEHTYSTKTTAATCTSAGSKVYTCTGCGSSYSESIPAKGHSYTSKVIAPTCTANGYTIYTCSACGHSYKGSTVAATGHSYSNGSCSKCGAADPNYSEVKQPTLTLKYPSLSFESEILYNVYYIAENIDDVVQMGLVTFDTEVADGTVANATSVTSGFETDGSLWKVNTNGISAKNLGDTLYFRVYAQMSDGSFVYSAMKSYSAINYANTILNRSTSSSYMKSLVVAMLNYGTEAQLYFDHKTDSLMNAGLTADQQALVKPYDGSMMDDVVAVDSTKAGSVVFNGTSFTRRAPTVSFDGAFSINYYFTTANVPDGDVKLYYWTLEDYNNATTLKPSNASGCYIMRPTDVQNQYWGQVGGIAAKELDETVFVAGFYYYQGVAYSTGVLNYSIGKYCEGIAAKDSSSQQALAQATAVYAYCAKEYFANN